VKNSLKALSDLNLSKDDREKILGDNAAAILRLGAS
jgi:predicted TIM-barrel fold metal-dependent hydrolase